MLPPHPVRPPASTRPLAQPPKQLAISFIRPFRSSLKNTPPRCSILIAALQLASPARPRQLHDTPRYPQISIARQGVAPFSLPLPRFRSLAVFVRRPGVRGTVREGPASENHLNSGPLAGPSLNGPGGPSTCWQPPYILKKPVPVVDEGALVDNDLPADLQTAR